MDWTLSVGNLIVAATIVFSAGGFYYVSRFEQQRTKEDFKGFRNEVKEDIGDIKSDLKALNKVVMDVAVQSTRLDNQDQRISAMERRWDEVRRGEGLITGR